MRRSKRPLWIIAFILGSALFYYRRQTSNIWSQYVPTFKDTICLENCAPASVAHIPGFADMGDFSSLFQPPDEAERARIEALIPGHEEIMKSKVPGRAPKKRPKLEYPAGFQRYDPDGTAYQNVTDSDVTTLQKLQKWVPYNPDFNLGTTNPVIWQSYDKVPGPKAKPFASWVVKNTPLYTRQFVDDTQLDALVTGLSRDFAVLNTTYYKLPKMSRLDFLRYLEMFRNGGVYADIDTECLQPIDAWYASCFTDSTIGGKPQKRTKQPGLLVGIEFDVNGDLGIANYVFAANRGHPVLAKIIASIVDDPTEFGTTPQEVIAKTGRKKWTDTIIAHIQESSRGFTSAALRSLSQAKVIDDICILPISAFGAGQRDYQNSPEAIAENGAMVRHFFMKSWHA